jgi:hypothetical protein
MRSPWRGKDSLYAHGSASGLRRARAPPTARGVRGTDRPTLVSTSIVPFLLDKGRGRACRMLNWSLACRTGGPSGSAGPAAAAARASAAPTPAIAASVAGRSHAIMTSCSWNRRSTSCQGRGRKGGAAGACDLKGSGLARRERRARAAGRVPRCADEQTGPHLLLREAVPGRGLEPALHRRAGAGRVGLGRERVGRAKVEVAGPPVQLGPGRAGRRAMGEGSWLLCGEQVCDVRPAFVGCSGVNARRAAAGEGSGRRARRRRVHQQGSARRPRAGAGRPAPRPSRAVARPTTPLHSPLSERAPVGRAGPGQAALAGVEALGVRGPLEVALAAVLKGREGLWRRRRGVRRRRRPGGARRGGGGGAGVPWSPRAAAGRRRARRAAAAPCAPCRAGPLPRT